MNNSRWKMNRIGLVDFWYYDEEEFHFLDGRMLLRGSNGSGKSVTMQSFIPLILDGNMRPERLDPFGSRARRMENYLLEEGDGREERTGYLYLELKRQEGNNYLTIGIGMRARKNKKLETWYFYISDGRRIGKNFFLYKDVESRIAYTRQELKNRIGDGGRVLESQQEYMETVNRLLFGFESVDKYKEMLDLLIQLRSPKLSKDFKPTVLNEILSNSLLMLSEDDLRPMSEAIENMDALKANLDALRESVNAARQIEKAYDHYNGIVLCRKAEQYVQAIRQLRDSGRMAAEFDQQLESLGQELTRTTAHYQMLEQEEQLLKEKRDSLSDSDAVRLKEQETDLRSQIAESEKERERKEEQIQEREVRYREIAGIIRQQTDQNDQMEKDIDEILAKMQETIGEIPFDEAAFLERELKENLQETYDFHAHNQLLETYQGKVAAGTCRLREEQQYKEIYDRELQNLDECRRERDQEERELQQMERQLVSVREELLENCYRWEKENQELKVPDETMQELSRAIRSFDERSDYHDCKELMRTRAGELENSVRGSMNKERYRLTQAQSVLEEKEKQLEELESSAELVPERRSSVQKKPQATGGAGDPVLSFLSGGGLCGRAGTGKGGQTGGSPGADGYFGRTDRPCGLSGTGAEPE